MSSEQVNPPHYKVNGIEAIDALAQNITPIEFMGYLKGNVYKYTFRAGRKGLKQDWITDIDKAIWYLERLKKELRI